MTQTALLKPKHDHQIMATIINHELRVAKTKLQIPSSVDQPQQAQLSPTTQRAAAGPAPPLQDDIENVKTDVAKPRRTRKFHKKVRTGCLTCKIRRKRCDETKPACNRCTSTGRKCDGYEPLSSSTAISQPAIPALENKNTARKLPFIRAQQVSKVVHADVLPPSTTHSDDDCDEVVVSQNIPYISSSQDSRFDCSYSPLASSSDAIDEANFEDFILSYQDWTAPSDSSLTSAGKGPSSEPSTFLCVSQAHSQALQTNHYQQHRRDSLSSAVLSRNIDFFPESLTDIESSCFSYFIHLTGPSFASYFDSTFWRTYCANLAFCHPVFFACATALGCVHRRFDYGISREAFEYCAHADRLVAKAKKMLSELKSLNINKNLLSEDAVCRTRVCKAAGTNGGWSFGVEDREVIMASEMFLGLFEGFQANYDAAVQHMNTGMRLMLDRPMVMRYSETRSHELDEMPDVFLHHFSWAQNRMQELLGIPVQILSMPSSAEPPPSVPKVFVNLAEAADFIFTEVDLIMKTPVAVWRDEARKREAKNMHVNRILRWSVAYAELTQKMERSFPQKTACRVLKWTRCAIYVLLYLVLYVDIGKDENVENILSKVSAGQDSLELGENHNTAAGSQDSIRNEAEDCTTYSYLCNDQDLWTRISQREELLTHVRWLTVLAEGIFDGTSPFYYTEHSVSFDSAIGPPRHHSKVPESSGKTRHLVKHLMQDSRREWEDSFGVYGVGERVSALEEHAVLGCLKGVIPESVNPRWVDITCMMEQRRVLLRYCHPSNEGGEMAWTQELWEF